MKISVLLTALGLLVAPCLSHAADEASPGAAAELQELVTEIKSKLGAGSRTPDALKAELEKFDRLIARHRQKDPEGAADILYMRGTLYSQVFEDDETARKIFSQLKADFPGTKRAAQIDRVLASMERQAAMKKARAELVGKAAPGLNFTWSTREGLKTLADLKGKVVVLDFWATWCGPCVASFPQVRELTAYYKGHDVEVVGVTSVQGYVMGLEPARIDTKGDPQKEMALMKDYIKAKDITWTITFSDEPVFNPAYGITGIPHMAILAPDGTIRHTGLHPAMPHAEKVQKIDALLKEFGKSTPTKG